ncbi:cation-translocating P-type ATPase [Hyphococcus sp. DH-69]|uniref:cation-translocating P-type ATPase n=1 Tax=Hyphococcus formosus TaxID=3143534 RepID=UPI00398AA7BC
MLSSPTTIHTETIDAAFKSLNTNSGGLSETEAIRRIEEFGLNELPDPECPTRISIILRQLNNPLTYILLFAATVSFVLKEQTDGFFICAVVIINVSVGAFQEWRAEASAASLKKTLQIFPTIIRAGTRRTIELNKIVPGDIVHLESGSMVPADMRLVSTHDLKADESLLTGESLPVEKNSKVICPVTSAIGDRRNLAFAGTMIVAGRGIGIAYATGEKSQIGEIATQLGERDMRPPLLIRMERFSNRIGVLIVSIAIALGLLQLYQNVPLESVFLLAVALSVSAIPEGLPVAITVALSVASSRMGQRNVIVRRLPAVEALGSCTIIATDKTGTLTANQLTAKRIALPDGSLFEIEGEGLELEGAAKLLGVGNGDAKAAIDELALVGALTNEGDLKWTDGVVEARGDSVDIAFLVLAEKRGLSSADLNNTFRHSDSIPYEPANGFSSSLHVNSEGGIISVKGAPEIILPMCKIGDTKVIDGALLGLTKKGFRVIALAAGQLRESQCQLEKSSLAGLRFLGFVGLIDPLRSEAPDAVRIARAAGLDIRMITGDHPETAMAIASKLDPSWPEDTVLTGTEMDRLEGDDLRQAIEKASIYARVEPTQKTIIVRSLQDAGHFVAVTGDGVNDAPALKAAHVGVAMGACGTDVARAASDLIISDDNFASIVSGIEEGRASYDNIRKIVWLLISTAITEVVIFAMALVIGLPIPLTPVQILWLNLVTEGIQDVALACEGKEQDLMRRNPRRPKEPIFNRQMIEQCLVIGGYISVVGFGLFYWLYVELGYDVELARNLVLLFLVSFNNFHTLNCRSETRSIFSIPLRNNPLLIWSVIAAQSIHIVAMQVPFFQELLDVNVVSIGEWGAMIGLAATVLVVGELYKLLRSRPLWKHELGSAVGMMRSIEQSADRGRN